MNKRSLNKKTIISLVIIVVIVSSLIVYVKNYDIMFILGQQVKSMQEKYKDESIAMVNGTKITKKGFESYKLIMNAGRENNNKLTDKEILDMIVERELIYSEAIKNNIIIDDSLVDETIKTAREELFKSPETYKQIIDYIKGIGWTEEQYWEMAKPTYKKVLTRGQYKNLLKQSFAKEKNITDQQQLTKQFDEYYKELIKEMKDKSKIEYFDMK